MPVSHFSQFLEDLSDDPLYVLSPSIDLKDYCFIDLSVSNKALESVDTSSSISLENYIEAYKFKNSAKVAYGGYLETRNIYQRSSYFTTSKADAQRNIHLGLDLWIEAGTAIFAPLDAEIHSFKNNTNHGDYGPTIILKHHIAGIEFYTLYGHLSLASLKGKAVGQPIKKGDTIATLGTAEVNGDYAPHLHFQIIKDMEGHIGDYPGVSNKNDVEHYKSNCPDPNVLLKIGV
ncbi:peptidoglycan DD-metalloendopeptidase family protein [Winogradskyella sp. A3E31]|uniref:peptidoglycan DD-metalloendopeptidase family protein n=1 Tax=Winogradskyella sp. A3E31 TaxID=3349637 RepID=UPI00398B0C75